jgi:hypothetical protein
MAKRDRYLLEQHVKKTCLPNLKNILNRTCATCPFEDQILEEFPDLRCLFIEKRRRKLNNNCENGECS